MIPLLDGGVKAIHIQMDDLARPHGEIIIAHHAARA
jgi:hemin uptake protein HemP